MRILATIITFYLLWYSEISLADYCDYLINQGKAQKTLLIHPKLNFTVDSNETTAQIWWSVTDKIKGDAYLALAETECYKYEIDTLLKSIQLLGDEIGIYYALENKADNLLDFIYDLEMNIVIVQDKMKENRATVQDLLFFEKEHDAAIADHEKIVIKLNELKSKGAPIDQSLWGLFDDYRNEDLKSLRLKNDIDHLNTWDVSVKGLYNATNMEPTFTASVTYNLGQIQHSQLQKQGYDAYIDHTQSDNYQIQALRKVKQQLNVILDTQIKKVAFLKEKNTSLKKEVNKFEDFKSSKTERLYRQYMFNLQKTKMDLEFVTIYIENLQKILE